MSEFKIGDKVRLISNPTMSQKIGDIGIIRNSSFSDNCLIVEYEACPGLFSENIRYIELLEEEKVFNTLIKTETKIKTGVYGLLELFSHDDHEVTIELRYTTAQAKELREAVTVLNENATILEGQNK